MNMSIYIEGRGARAESSALPLPFRFRFLFRSLFRSLVNNCRLLSYSSPPHYTPIHRDTWTEELVSQITQVSNAIHSIRSRIRNNPTYSSEETTAVAPFHGMRCVISQQRFIALDLYHRDRDS
jgi:hypothetical protein